MEIKRSVLGLQCFIAIFISVMKLIAIFIEILNVNSDNLIGASKINANIEYVVKTYFKRFRFIVQHDSTEYFMNLFHIFIWI